RCALATRRSSTGSPPPAPWPACTPRSWTTCPATGPRPEPAPGWPSRNGLLRKERTMYNGVPVLDVHGHVSVPFAATSVLMLMRGSNPPMASPVGQPKAGPAGVSVEEFQAAAAGHARYLDERNIDVQVIGPRPFLMLGWMEPHLLPSWARYVN